MSRVSLRLNTFYSFRDRFIKLRVDTIQKSDTIAHYIHCV